MSEIMKCEPLYISITYVKKYILVDFCPNYIKSNHCINNINVHIYLFTMIYIIT